MLEQLPDSAWEDGKTFCDPAAGNGQFLVPVLLIKQTLGHKNPLASIYGAELLEDNAAECRYRLIEVAGNNEENLAIVRWNIRCADALTFDFDEFERD